MQRMHARAIIATLTAALSTGCLTTGTRTARGNADGLDSHTRIEARGAPALAVARDPNPLDSCPADSITIERTARTRHTDHDATTPPPTIRQRVAAIFGTFSGFALVAVALLAAFAPGVLCAFLARSLLRWKAAFTETVAAIHQSDAVNTTPALHDALLAAQTPKTRALVEVAKRDA